MSVSCVHICEKQLLNLIMNLLKYYTFIGSVYLALKNFPSADIETNTTSFCPLPLSEKKQLLLVLCSVTLQDSYAWQIVLKVKYLSYYDNNSYRHG